MPHPKKNSLPDPRRPHERLSCQCYLIAQRVARGTPTSAIASELQIHRKTVQRTIARICRTMGLASGEDIEKYNKKHAVF